MHIIMNMDVISKNKRRVAIVLFILYLIVLCYFLFFSESMGRTYSERSYHYNLMPLKEIKRFLKYWRILGIGAVAINLVGNIAAFMPFGAFLPLFWGRCRKLWRTALYGFEFSLFVETLQLISKVGSFDVDDMILNTIGAIAGFFACRALIRRKQERERKEEEHTGTT